MNPTEESFILNGQAHGTVAQRLLKANFDVDALRPFIGSNGRNYINVNQGGKTSTRLTANATLLKDEWIQLDGTVQRVAREELRLFGDIRGLPGTYTLPGGMAKTILETQRMGDMTDAGTSMDGLVDTEGDRPEFDLVGIPLPIHHKQFGISARQLATSRQGGAPLDTTGVELATRKVAERIEKATAGTLTEYAWGGYTLYGLRNFPQRLTGTFTLPTTAGWTPKTLLLEFLAMKQALFDAYHRGPYRVYFAPNWAQYLEDDFSAAKGDLTVRERLARVNRISSIEIADHLPSYDVVMVQTTSDVVRAVVGLDFTTVEWEEKGGLALNFMVMAIMMIQIRADYNSRCGLAHYTGV